MCNMILLNRTQKITKRVYLLSGFILLFAGCLQKDYDYVKTPIDPYVPMTAWEFIQSRPDEFSLMQEAIVHAGMQDLYHQTTRKYTYLLINNQGMISFLGTYGSETAETLDPELIRKMLSYHVNIRPKIKSLALYHVKLARYQILRYQILKPFIDKALNMV